MRLAWSLLALSCAATPSTGMQPPPPTLSGSDIHPGQPMTLTVLGAPAGQRVYFVVETPNGNPPCPPPLGGQCFSLSAYTLLGSAVESGGAATLTVTVPPQLSDGMPVSFQAAYARQGIQLSNVWSEDVTFPQPTFDDDPDPHPAEHPYRVIGRLDLGLTDCPMPERLGWTVSPLFPGATSDATERYCLYEGDRQDPNFDEGPMRTMALGVGTTYLSAHRMQVNYDRVSIAAMSTQTAMARDLSTKFLHTAGAPDWNGGAPAFPGRARLTLIDTSPRLEPPATFHTPGPAQHGYLLAQLARMFACESGDETRCFIDVASRPALTMDTPPWPSGVVPTDPPEAWEGAWGTIAMLATAIRDEVDHWEAMGTGEPLILNLSVGWHPFFDGGVDNGIEIREEGAIIDTLVPTATGGPLGFFWNAVSPALWAGDVHAVFDALAEARCKGVLVIGATGNDSGGTIGDTGPMLPAAWSAMPISSLPPCSTFGLPDPPDLDNTPLLYAAGGINADGKDLSVSRPKSRPPFLATADHALSDLYANDEKPMSGTSVAALVVSSAAALEWSYDPQLSPYQVMDTLYGNSRAHREVDGPFLDLPADWVSGFDASNTDAARIVRPCDATGRLQCLSPIAITPEPTPIPGTMSATVDLSNQLSAPACGPGSFIQFAVPFSSPPTSTWCPSTQLFGPQITPWTYPQPQGTQCPFCFLNTVQGEIYIELPVPTNWFQSISVRMEDDSGNRFTYTIPDNLLGNANALNLDFPPNSLPPNLIKARVVVVKDDTSQSSEMALKR